MEPTIVGEAKALDLRPFEEALIMEACAYLDGEQPMTAIEIYVSLRKGRDIGTALRADLRPLEERLLARAEASLVGYQAWGGVRNIPEIHVSTTDPGRIGRAIYDAVERR